jgi:hypothetical protein
MNPVAYINVEERKLEWAKPTTWHTPTIAQMDKIPLYTHPAKTLTDEEILAAIKCIADDVSPHKEYENTYEDGWLDACNTVYDEVFAILKKASEK